MKQTLTEQIKRIHVLTYGKSLLKENIVDDLLGLVKNKKIDDPKIKGFIGQMMYEQLKSGNMGKYI